MNTLPAPTAALDPTIPTIVARRGDQAAAQARALADAPPAERARLHAAAAAQVAYAPGDAWVIAHALHATLPPDSPPEERAAALALLAAAWSALGEFAAAIPLALEAAEVYFGQTALTQRHGGTEEHGERQERRCGFPTARAAIPFRPTEGQPPDTTRGEADAQGTASTQRRRGAEERVESRESAEKGAACLLDAAHAQLELRRHAGAEATLARAAESIAGVGDEAALSLRLACLRARLHHFRREGQAARTLAGEAVTLAERLGDPAAPAAARLELARALFGFDPAAALGLLDAVEAYYANDGRPVAAAHARYYRGLALDQANRHAEALACFDAARAAFAAHAVDHYVALADAMRCAALWRLSRYDDALAAGEQARVWFAARSLPVWTAMCCNNLAIVHYARRALPAAAALYAEAAALARGEALPLDEAMCRVNLGLVAAEQGDYDRALASVQRARALFAGEGRALMVAECDQNLAGLLLRLGRHTDAAAQLQAVRADFARLGRPLDAALTAAQLADLSLALGQPALARRAAADALAALEAQGAPHQAALARRLHGAALAALGDLNAGRAEIEAARAHFTAHGLEADAALCDLALGEALAAQGGHSTEAAALLERAAPLVAAAAPAVAWRVDDALAACAAEQGDAPAALAHSLAALARVGEQRARLPTEQWSGAFGAAQARLHARALAHALTLGDDRAALAVAEAAKTQSFSARLGTRPAVWSRRRPLPERAQSQPVLERASAPFPEEVDTESDPYTAGLLAEEARLRRALEEAQQAARVGFAPDSAAPAPAANLRALAADYERTVEALRVARPRAGVGTGGGALLDLDGLRRALGAGGQPWAALSYAQHGDRLLLFLADGTRLLRRDVTPDNLGRALLRQAAATDAASRALVYGARPGAPPQRHLAALGARLLPPDVAALLDAGGPTTRLFLSPDGPLHALPLHALEVGGLPLAARAAVTYTPSLAALARLLALPPAPDRARAVAPALVCGLEEFGGRAAPLPAARAEVEAVAAAAERAGTPARVLWGPEAATRAALLGMSEAGALRGVCALHFATHARLAHDAPSRSALLLGDGALTFYDILTLDLDAGVVTLAACDGAAGKEVGANELMSLAWAWLQAGARSVVASLWPAPDAWAARLMGEFYAHLPLHAPGPWPPGTVAAALAAAQSALRAAGAPLYAWAPWVVIGY